MKPHTNKILVVRNDKLGDFVLSFPALRMLRRGLPDTEIHVLVPAYTRPIAEMNPDIDRVLLDPGQAAGWRGLWQLSGLIRRERYRAVITLFSTTRIGLACWLSRIPLRIAPATKLAQIFYNYRIRQRRSHSEKPEYVYNADLANYFLELQQRKPEAVPLAPYIEVPESVQHELRRTFIAQHAIPPDHDLIFIHPGSGGSAVNLSLAQYAELANSLHCPVPSTIVISCASAEADQARKLAELLTIPHVVYVSDEGLQRFVEHISLARIFISGSTGPLHIAGALNRPTAGFYPNRRSATPLRWQTLSTDDRRLVFSPPTEAEAEDMGQVDIGVAARTISALLEKLHTNR
ncbi:MAG: lipopolysaccharide heptosyltransferase family protein [Gammaproteobacteria bacterium]|nr:lipopolysaccharide heptosyltransferase family protein [Gammaproteobacteria bacterium]